MRFWVFLYLRVGLKSFNLNWLVNVADVVFFILDHTVWDCVFLQGLNPWHVLSVPLSFLIMLKNCKKMLAEELTVTKVRRATMWHDIPCTKCFMTVISPGPDQLLGHHKVP